MLAQSQVGMLEIILADRDKEWLRQNDKGYSRPATRARELRQNATEAERKLWGVLRNRQIRGVRFNRQFPVGQFICDFASRERRPVIELDGGQHALTAQYDARRTAFLEGEGYRVMRFWNNEVMDNLDGVTTRIEEVLDNMPSPSPSRRREGSLWIHPLRGGRP
jgi:very-short-patch-repair endonuclease